MLYALEYRETFTCPVFVEAKSRREAVKKGNEYITGGSMRWQSAGLRLHRCRPATQDEVARESSDN